MKRNGILILLLISIFFTAQAKKKPVESPTVTTLKTALDSVSYALGVQIGNDLSEYLKSFPGEPLQLDLFLEAVSKLIKADSSGLLIKQEKTQEIIQTYAMRVEEEMSKKAEAENAIFLENNKKNPNVVTTESGLQYEVLQEGNGVKPKATDMVKVHYHGTLIDGTVFDSSVERGEPIELPLNQVIPGWTEGLQLMSVGSKYKFYIPPKLAYAANSVGSIKPNSILIFEVELLEVREQ